MGIAKAHYNHTTNGNVSLKEFLLQNLDRLFSLSRDSLLIDTKFRSYRKYFFRVIPSNFDKEKSYRTSEFLSSIDKKEFCALGQHMTNLNLAMSNLHRGDKPITVSVIEHFKKAVNDYIQGLENGTENLFLMEQALKNKPELV